MEPSWIGLNRTAPYSTISRTANVWAITNTARFIKIVVNVGVWTECGMAKAELRKSVEEALYNSFSAFEYGYQGIQFF